MMTSWPDTYPEMRAAIREQLGVGDEEAHRLIDAGRHLWEPLEDAGIVDGFGSTECHRVFPAVLAFLRETANRPADFSVPEDWR